MDIDRECRGLGGEQSEPGNRLLEAVTRQAGNQERDWGEELRLGERHPITVRGGERAEVRGARNDPRKERKKQFTAKSKGRVRLNRREDAGGIEWDKVKQADMHLTHTANYNVCLNLYCTSAKYNAAVCSSIAHAYASQICPLGEIRGQQRRRVGLAEGCGLTFGQVSINITKKKQKEDAPKRINVKTYAGWIHSNAAAMPRKYGKSAFTFAGMPKSARRARDGTTRGMAYAGGDFKVAAQGWAAGGRLTKCSLTRLSEANWRAPCFLKPTRVALNQHLVYANAAGAFRVICIVNSATSSNLTLIPPSPQPVQGKRPEVASDLLASSF
ncbi:hypothetical protein B0H19DRAFT_1325622 [Mycena capillaripes]|nr:hypothetical protein B0H19DRAFT_1325622 [Mycena capillaripes]